MSNEEYAKLLLASEFKGLEEKIKERDIIIGSLIKSLLVEGLVEKSIIFRAYVYSRDTIPEEKVREIFEEAKKVFNVNCAPGFGI